MRHVNFKTTMNVYTSAITTAKRDAQSRVVDMLMKSSRGCEREDADDRRRNQRIFAVSRFSPFFSKFLIYMVGTAGFEPTTSTV